MKNLVWLICYEWWANSEMVSENFPKYNLTVYKGISGRKAYEIKEQAEKYSPYDYLDFDTFESEQEFNEKLEYLLAMGAVLKQ